jgi:hypothetical protein
VDVKIAIPERHVSEGPLNAGLEMTTRVNEALIKEGSAPTFREAIKRGVKWAPEPPGQESFDHAAKVVARGWGDCDDLGPYRAADLRVSGQDPGATSVVYKSGPGRWHAIVKRSDGTLEDPSRTAGMKVRQGSRAAGIAPAVVGSMGLSVVGGSVRPFVAVRRNESGYLARVDVPVEGTDAFLSCSQPGRSPSHALAGCMAGACMVGSSSGMVDSDALDKMWAVSGLMKGSSLKEVSSVCGVEATKDALKTLQAIAPDLVAELRKHWGDARALREDFDRMNAQKQVAAGGAVPFVGGRHAKHHKHHHHHVRGDGPGATYMQPGEWSSRLAHERVVSPYAERFGHRGQQFVGGAVGVATNSPYLEMVVQRRTWGNPRAFGSEQAFTDDNPIARVQGYGATDMGSSEAEWSSRLGHERVTSPFAERFGHRGRQFVGGVGVGFVPHLSFSLAGEHPGYAASPSNARPPRSAEALKQEVDNILDRGRRIEPRPGLAAAIADGAIMSALRAAPFGHGMRRRAAPSLYSPRDMVRHANVSAALDRALHAPAIVGWDFFQDVVKPAGDSISNASADILRAASNVIPGHPDLVKALSDMGHAVDQVSKVAIPILQEAVGVISLIPGIGTGISAAISAGLAILQGGSPLEIALKTALGAIPLPPGLRSVLDPIIDVALSLVNTHDFGDAAIAGARKAVIDNLPSFAQGLGGTVFDTLAHIVLGSVHKQATTAVVAKSPAAGFPPKVATISTPSMFQMLAQVAQQGAQLQANQAAAQARAKAMAAPAKGWAPNWMAAAAPPKPAAAAVAPPTPKPAAAPPPKPVHVISLRGKAPVPKLVMMPIRAAAPLPAGAPPPKPIAAVSLSVFVRTTKPQVIRHMVAVPKGSAVSA